jgi:hypothetical protein
MLRTMWEKYGVRRPDGGTALWFVLGGAVAAVFAVGTVATMRRHEQLVAAVPPQMHRAVYDLSIDHVKSTDELQALDGRMVVEWRGGPSCEGYTSDQRVVTHSVDADGHDSYSDVRLNSWEALDGSDFRFDRAEYVDGKLSLRETGEVKRANGKITLVEQGKDPVTMPAEVMFPSVFNIALIKAAQQGHSIFSGALFDGTQAAASNVTAFIGKPGAASADALSVAIKNRGKGQRLRATPAWPVRMSYFDITGDEPADSTPSFEMGFSMFPNGVMSGLKLDYDDVTLKGVLTQIEYFKPGAC